MIEPKGIYLGEDGDLIIDCFDIDTCQPLDITQDYEFGMILYTNKFDPIYLSTLEEFDGHSGDDLIHIEKDGTQLKAVLSSDLTATMRPGRATLEILVMYKGKNWWRSVAKYNGIAEFLPSMM